jgi:hypothetical protein
MIGRSLEDVVGLEPKVLTMCVSMLTESSTISTVLTTELSRKSR